MDEEPVFQDRQLEVKKILSREYSLLNIFGEPGIGKTRLLQECQKIWKASGQPIKIISVDFKTIQEGLELEQGAAGAVIRAIQNQAPEWFEPRPGETAQQAVFKIVKHFKHAAQAAGDDHAGTVILFDNTETMQNQKKFWSWMEEHLISPLLHLKVNMIFSGRVPLRWDDFEVRRCASEPLQLLPLDDGGVNQPAYAMALELLRRGGQRQEHETQQWIPILLELSAGHPRLIELLARALAQQPPAESPAGVRAWLSETVVYPFIQDCLFEGVAADWKILLWWMSILDEINVTYLEAYLKQVAPELVSDQPLFYFMEGIRSLRERSLLEWKVGLGDQFKPVIGQIVRRCFATIGAADYQRANRAAANTYRMLAADFLEFEDEEKQDYENRAVSYDQRVR